MIGLEIYRNIISRLHAKAEELENLVNAEATDIEEVLTMINGMQVSPLNFEDCISVNFGIKNI